MNWKLGENPLDVFEHKSFADNSSLDDSEVMRIGPLGMTS